MASFPVTIWTLWHGAEVSGEGSFELLADEVRLRVPSAGAELAVPLAALDGARVAPAHVTLYADTGDVVELTGSNDLDEAGRHLKARACTLPELTLALRGLGSARGYPGSDHDRFFGPLLAARRAAQRASDPPGRLAAMRAAALAAELDRVFHEFAAERFPTNPSERRALETTFEDLAAPVRASLGSSRMRPARRRRRGTIRRSCGGAHGRRSVGRCLRTPTGAGLRRPRSWPARQ